MSPGGPRRSRRETRLLQAVGIAVVGVVGAGIWMAYATRPPPAYVPGEQVEGLTDALGRDLPEDRPSLRFTDVTAEAGIDFRHFGGVRSSQIVEDMGSGAAWGDYDRDGFPDLYVVNIAGPVGPDGDLRETSDARAHLYRNRGDGTFEEVAESAGVDLRAVGMGAAWADFDNDGWPDLVVSSHPDLHLFRNDRAGGFEDVSAAAGLAGHRGFWSGVSWADYDRDGFLDLYVAGYVRYEPRGAGDTSSQYDEEVPSSLNPSSFEPERNLLFHNLGDGTFRERAAEAGVDDPRGRGLSAAWLDFDADGWTDLYVANDVSDNALLRNLGDGTFQNVSHPSLVADYRGAMGIAVGDWDGDEDMDLFLTHWIAQENALYSNLLTQLAGPDGEPTSTQFRDDADRFGLGQIALDYVGWATSFVDFDNDGRPDLFVVNGSTFQDDDDPTRLIAMPDQIFWNAGVARGFFDISSAVGDYFASTYVGRGGAVADYDLDGDPDLFINNHGGPGVLLRNDGDHGAWLRVSVTGTDGNADALGARVKVFRRDGTTATKAVGSQASYLSQNEHTLHFGLGADSAVDSLVVAWPGGARQSVGEIPARAEVRVREDGAVEVHPVVPALSEDERVRRFWETYRAAGRARIEGRSEEALTGYRTTVLLDPGHADSWYYRGQLARELGLLDEAVEAFTTLIRVDATSARAHRELGWLHLCTEQDAPRDPEAAQLHFQRAFEINREHTQASLDLAVAELATGRDGQAGERARQVLRTDPANPGARYLLAYLAGRGFSRGGHRQRCWAHDPGSGGLRRTRLVLGVGRRRGAKRRGSAGVPSRLSPSGPGHEVRGRLMLRRAGSPWPGPCCSLTQ